MLCLGWGSYRTKGQSETPETGAPHAPSCAIQGQRCRTCPWPGRAQASPTVAPANVFSTNPRIIQTS